MLQYNLTLPPARVAHRERWLVKPNLLECANIRTSVRLKKRILRTNGKNNRTSVRQNPNIKIPNTCSPLAAALGGREESHSRRAAKEKIFCPFRNSIKINKCYIQCHIIKHLFITLINSFALVKQIIDLSVYLFIDLLLCLSLVLFVQTTEQLSFLVDSFALSTRTFCPSIIFGAGKEELA